MLDTVGMENTSDSDNEEIPRDPVDVATCWTTEPVDDKGSEDDDDDDDDNDDSYVVGEAAEGMTVLSMVDIGEGLDADEGEAVVASEPGLLHVLLRSRRQPL